MNLNEFMEKNKSRRKLEFVLKEKMDDIAKLKSKGFPDIVICDYLKEHKISVCQTTLSAFMKKEGVNNDRQEGEQNGSE
jgi:uncharacterized protein YehS (DUF1456 family)